MENLAALNQQCIEISTELECVQEELKRVKEQRKRLEQNRTDKLIAVSEFNRFKATADTEILKLQDDKKCVDQKTLQLQEEYIDTVPLKFKTLGISFELISAEMVTRVRLLQSEIDQLKSQEATQLPIWTQDLLKREQDLANILAKLSLGQIRDDLFLIESEEKLNEDIDTEEGSLIILRRRVLSARERIDGIRRHSSQQKDQTPQTQPMVSYSAPMSSATAQESSDFQPSPVVHTITTTITKTLIEEEVMVSCDETTYHSQSQPYLDSSTYQQHQQNFQYGGLGPRGGVDGGEQLWFRTMKRRKVLSGPADIRGPNDHTQEHNTPRNTAYDDVEWNYDIQE